MTHLLDFAPMLPLPVIAVLGGLGLTLVAITLFRGGPGAVARLAIFAVLVAALLNPRIVEEEREPQSDIAVLALDRTHSQSIGHRQAQTAAALKEIRSRLANFDNLEVQEVEIHDQVAGVEGNDEAREGTHLFRALDRVIADIPSDRFAGAVIITDGQIHDVPDRTTHPHGFESAPLQVLLTGAPDESDRRLVVEKAPSYGIVGREISITYRVEDNRAETAIGFGSNLAEVTLTAGDTILGRAQAPVGRSHTFTFKLEHAGPTVMELDVTAVEGELSTVNNKALVSINGVRDRLRVLLVSGQPHAGERTWRNLLKSDPSVDLVHFTILRPPEKDDFTPLNELALIAFPVRELFEVKIDEFDLIVFDRYVVRDVLPPSYYRNIDQYVRDGGAVMFSVGPEFASIRSLYQTPLGKLIPSAPTGQVIEAPFRPTVSKLGRRHPVTAGLEDAGLAETSGKPNSEPAWGRWFRQIDAAANGGQTIMEGADNRPLLVLDRAGKGRVAQMLSDHIWLWARGFDGGGPQAELLRRLAHWLMKEPDLEEESLRARVENGKLEIQRTSLDAATREITVRSPSGKTDTLILEPNEDGGPAVIAVPATEPGLYRIGDGDRTTVAASGTLNPLELADLRATAALLEPAAKATAGGVFWLADGLPELRRVKPGRDRAGKGWAGLLRNDAYVVTGVTQVSLLPPMAFLILALVAMMAAWWREGR